MVDLGMHYGYPKSRQAGGIRSKGERILGGDLVHGRAARAHATRSGGRDFRYPDRPWNADRSKGR